MNNNRNSEVAQFVILDVGVPNLASTSEAVLTSVGNILCMSQGDHVPAVGLSLINANYQPVIRLSSTQTPQKLQKILRALDSVKNTGKCRGRISAEEFKDNVHLGIKSALDDFETLQNQLTEAEVCPEKLQITIFSMKNLSETLNHIQTALSHFKKSFLSKILVVELVEDFLNPCCLKRDNSVSTFLEFVKVAGTAKRIDELMKQRLLCGDVQHVKLVMQDIVILCDARECLVRPSPSPPLESSQEPLEEAVDEEEVLEVIHRLPTEGVCETHMFGDPVLLMPCHWQNHLKSENYEEFTFNSKYFSSICSSLETSDEYLITKYETTNRPMRYFLLMPGEGCLLARELVSAEIVLPIPHSAEHLRTCSALEVDSTVTTTLESVPSIPSYNPGDFSSGLYKHLWQKILRPEPKQKKQEPLCPHPSEDSLIFSLEVKKKTKLKKRSYKKRKLRKYTESDLPQLTDQQHTKSLFDKQILDKCFPVPKKTFNMTLP